MAVTFAPTEQAPAPRRNRVFPELTAPRSRFGLAFRQWTAALATVAVFAGLAVLFKVVDDRPETVLSLGLVLLGVMAVLRWPIVGTYLAVLSTIILDTFPSPYVQTVISEMGFFRNLNLLGLPSAVTFNMFEVLLSLSLLRAVIGHFHRYRGIRTGPVFWPVVLFGAMVLLGTVNGLLTGGDFKITLWEIRPLFYFVGLYILAVNTVDEPAHVRGLLWITVLGTAFRTVDGISRYFQIPLSVRSGVPTVIEHDDSLFLALAFGLLIAATVWRTRLPRRMYPLLVLMIPAVTLMMVLNKRRAVFLCLIEVVIIALPYIWLSLQTPALRRRLVLILVGLGVLGGLYTAAFWNRSGSLAEPAQAVKSYFQPNERDAASNAYRDQENTNLRATIAHSPVIGIGFGKPMDVVVPMANLQDGWALQLYMPHNNMLWLWERMGFIGFAVFWAMIAASLILVSAAVRLGLDRMRAAVEVEQELLRGNPLENTMRGRRRRLNSADRVYARRLQVARKRAQECAEFLLLAFLVLGTLGALVVLSAVDQALMSFRLSAYAGAMLGALAAGWQMYQVRARRLPGEAVADAARQEEPPRVPRRRVRFVS
jgi:hypothetical protein